MGGLLRTQSFRSCASNRWTGKIATEIDQYESTHFARGKIIVHLLLVYSFAEKHKHRHRKGCCVLCASRVSRLTNWWPVKKRSNNDVNAFALSHDCTERCRCKKFDELCGATPSLKGKSFRLIRRNFTFNIFRGSLGRLHRKHNLAKRLWLKLFSLCHGRELAKQQQQLFDFRLWCRNAARKSLFIQSQGWTNIAPHFSRCRATRLISARFELLLTFSHPWNRNLRRCLSRCEILCSGWKDQPRKLFSSFSRNKNYFPTLCSKLLAELKIKLFRYFFFLLTANNFCVHFWFSLRCTVFRLQLWHFYFSSRPVIHFFLLFSKLLELLDTHPVKAKAFVAFGKPRPTTNFMWLRSNLCYCWNRTEILSVGVPSSTNTTERAQFDFTLRIFPCSMRKCAPPPASVGVWYPSRASAFTTTLGFMFSLIFRKRIPNVYALTPRRPTLSTARTSPFPFRWTLTATSQHSA